MNGNLRWVDDLFRRMQQSPETKNIAVLNAGIGGNHLNTDPGQGPNAVARIGRDVLAQPGIRYVAILDGVNDIGHTVATAKAQDELYYTLVAGLEQFIAQVHAFGLPVFGATLTPFHDPPYSNKTSNYSNPFREVTRNRLNDWIVNHSKFDYVVDYAGATANKTSPNQYQDQYAFTNYIHPNDLGHQAMADAWDLGVFKKFSNGVSGYC
jgi:lysophospholipase L1-like esterase